MKKFILLVLPLLALSLMSCTKDDGSEAQPPNYTIFEKIYTMKYVEGDYSEIIPVTVKITHITVTLLQVNYTANNKSYRFAFYDSGNDNIFRWDYDDDKICFDNVRYNLDYYAGYFCTNNEKTSTLKVSEDEDATQLIHTLIEIQ